MKTVGGAKLFPVTLPIIGRKSRPIFQVLKKGGEKMFLGSNLGLHCFSMMLAINGRI